MPTVKSGEWELDTDGGGNPLVLRKGIHQYMAAEEYDTVPIHKKFEAMARGDVLLGGLGIGMDERIIRDKPEVRSIDVVEISEDVINLCGKFLGKLKTKLFHADFDEYIKVCKKRYDVIFLDFTVDRYTGEQKAGYRKSLARVLKPEGIIMFWALP